ncbi:hypothetical protein SB778_38425, partial [Paraburkholderia sp. SIMBA_050]
VVHRGNCHVDRPRRAAIRSRDVTAHFNEIDRLTSRFFVKIPARPGFAERIGRMLRLSWTRGPSRAAAWLSNAKGSNTAHASRLNCSA